MLSTCPPRRLARICHQGHGLRHVQALEPLGAGRKAYQGIRLRPVTTRAGAWTRPEGRRPPADSGRHGASPMHHIAVRAVPTLSAGECRADHDHGEKCGLEWGRDADDPHFCTARRDLLHRPAGGLDADLRDRPGHPGRSRAHRARAERDRRAGRQAARRTPARRADHHPVRALPERACAGRSRHLALHQPARGGGHRAVSAGHAGADLRRRRDDDRDRAAARHRVRALARHLDRQRHPNDRPARGLGAEASSGP